MPADYGTIPRAAINTPEPFNVTISEEQLRDFRILLQLSKVPSATYESLQEDGRYGISHKWTTDTKKYWEDEFDWRLCESRINSFPNFIARVKVGEEESMIHFVGLFSEKEDAIPITLFHGWPGNFLEFLPILALMKEKYTPQTLPYHLLVPSLPGYAFSSTPPLYRDFGRLDICKVMNQLMIDLGFGSGYIAQGGDIGSGIARTLAAEYEACKERVAIHINYAPVLSPPKGFSISSLNERDKSGIKRGEEFVAMGAGYSLEQATKPSTIGIVLGSNPLALLAWIGEKFLAWSDTDPTLDQILESVTLYWFTESMSRGVYPYRGRFLPTPQPGTQYLEKPIGYSNFPKEITPTPRAWVETTGNLVFYREHDKGGHFAALEQPKLLMMDLEAFVEQVWAVKREL